MGITQKSLENTKRNRQENKQDTETRTEGKMALFIQKTLIRKTTTMGQEEKSN